MNVLLTGASGFIGKRLIDKLVSGGHSVRVLGRKAPPGPVEFLEWEAEAAGVPGEALKGVDAIVNLSGEPIAQRWNREIKSRIRNSRVIGTHSLVQAIANRPDRPQTFVSASAIGYYGDRGSEELTEESSPGTGFLSDICSEWEREAQEAAGQGVRVAILRLGIVLGKEGGALKQMLPPFRLAMGGPMASGKQWMSWIHADDVVNAILFAIENPKLSGAINATALNPVENAEFAKALGEALNRPAVVNTPAFALKMMLGEAAEVALASQRVLPKRLEQAGFHWLYPNVREALLAAVY